MKYLHVILVFLLFFLTLMKTQGQNDLQPPNLPEEKTITRILFIFDASQSMYGRWQSDIKFNIARNILSKALDSISQLKDVEVALRVYGHQYTFPPQVCTDTRLEVPFGKDNLPRIKSKLSSLIPKGTSPIAYSMAQAIYDFTPCENCRNIIILITDGIEECGGDPCEVSKTLQKHGVVLKPFIIGIGTNFEDAFDCVGSYFDASYEMQLGKVLNVVISRALNPTTTQVDLLDKFGKATETNVPMTFYDNLTGQVRYNFIHTMNYMHVPDTLIIDPLITYDIVVHTLPPVRADSVRIIPGQHTVIPISAPQGYLTIRMSGVTNVAKDIKSIVRRKGSMETVNIQDVGSTMKYITGTYNLEILSMPRIYFNDLKVAQSDTTVIGLPVPGIAVIQKNSKGYGSIFVEREGKLTWVYKFQEEIAGQESIVLMPGIYHTIFRTKYINRSIFTVEKIFEIKSGLTTNIKLFD